MALTYILLEYRVSGYIIRVSSERANKRDAFDISFHF